MAGTQTGIYLGINQKNAWGNARNPTGAVGRRTPDNADKAVVSSSCLLPRLPSGAAVFVTSVPCPDGSRLIDNPIVSIRERVCKDLTLAISQKSGIRGFAESKRMGPPVPGLATATRRANARRECPRGGCLAGRQPMAGNFCRSQCCSRLLSGWPTA